MGTRAITNVFDGDEHLVTIYRQSDGYISHHGAEIAKAFHGCVLRNGITFDLPRNLQVNGMGCAAARLIAFLKKDMEAGCIYIKAPSPDATEEYTYTLTGDTMNPSAGMRLKVEAYGRIAFDGQLQDFDPEKADEALSAPTTP